MSLEKAKKKLKELLPIMEECFPGLGNELLQPSIRLVDSELGKLENLKKYSQGYGAGEPDTEDRAEAIKRMQEEAAAQLEAKAEKPVPKEAAPEAAAWEAAHTPEYEEFLQWKADKIAGEEGSEDSEAEAGTGKQEATESEPEKAAQTSKEAEAAAEAEKAATKEETTMVAGAPKKAPGKVATKEEV